MAVHLKAPLFDAALIARHDVPGPRYNHYAAAPQFHSRFGAAAADAQAPDFCRTCALFTACSMVGYGKPELSPLHTLMEHLGPFRAGETIFRRGDPFEAVYAVRTGAVKTERRDREERERVLGFYLPGEVIGLNAIHPGRFQCDAVALDSTFLCRFSFAAMSGLAQDEPPVQHHLLRLLSKQLCNATMLVGEHGADERMAAFLVDLGTRYARRGFSSTAFRLQMSRGDIADYLHLATETVSRVLARFRTRTLIRLEDRDIELLDCEQLRQIGRALLPC